MDNLKGDGHAVKESIVVGVSASEANKVALTWAIHRAAALKLPVVLVHVVDDRWMTESSAYTEMARASGKKLLSNAKAHAAEIEPTVDVKTALVSGSVGYTLRKRSKGASIVVIGFGNHVSIGGPMADRALQIAAVALCPVAVIGEQEVDNRHGVLVGVDGSKESTQSVAFAASEADRNGQELTVLHAFRGPSLWVEKGMPQSNLAEQLAERERIVLAETVAGLAEDYPDLVVHQILETDKEPASALAEAAESAQLLVLGSRGRGTFNRLLLGSTAHAVLAQLACPTIVTRARRVKNTR